jgi:hypothetical protein
MRKGNQQGGVDPVCAGKPDAGLAESAKSFGCTAQTVFYALRNLGATLKKGLQILRSLGGTTRGVLDQTRRNP